MADTLKLFWDRDESIALAGAGVSAQLFGLAHPTVNSLVHNFLQPISGARRGLVLAAGTYIKMVIPDGEGKPQHFVFGVDKDLSIPYAEARLDSGVSFVQGRDYYIYLCFQPATDTVKVPWADIVISLNSTFPTGYNANTSRKIGGFHTLCAGAGTLPNNPIDSTPHPASGFQTGDIIPNSVWCLTHRSAGKFQEGTAYVDVLDEWHFIYMASGIGLNTRSVFGGTVTKSRTQVQHLDDLLRVGYRLLDDSSCMISSDGSNAQTNIQGSAAPITTGAHVDTAGRRMISKYFLEDLCGAYWIWLEDLGFNGQTGWTSVPDGQGQTFGVPYALIAGGAWSDAAYCGPRCRSCGASRLGVSASVAARGRAPSRKM